MVLINPNRKRFPIFLLFVYRHLNTTNIFSYQEVTKKNYKTLYKIHVPENTS